ncbi:MAG TPA: hypothetical protein VK169_13570 [Saprospiraceae bacterium]|nr:hypothetical protein [Saprospiraceae bacterium]
MNEPFINYLNDTIKELIISAKEIKNTDDFNKGLRIGFYKTISILLSQANAFGVYEKLDSEIRDFNLESLI